MCVCVCVCNKSTSLTNRAPSPRTWLIEILNIVRFNVEIFEE